MFGKLTLAEWNVDLITFHWGHKSILRPKFQDMLFFKAYIRKTRIKSRKFMKEEKEISINRNKWVLMKSLRKVDNKLNQQNNLWKKQ